MKKLPLQSRLEYWKYQCASLTFYNAKAVAESMICPEQPPLVYPLLTSLYVLYGRPFKQRKRVRVSEELVPSEYAKEHGVLIGLRDKMFAHVDTDGLPSQNIQHLSNIWLGYRDGGFKAPLEWQVSFQLALLRIANDPWRYQIALYEDYINT
jgi:hypothetical protein